MSWKVYATELKQTFINELYQNAIKSYQILAFLLLLKVKLYVQQKPR